MKAILLFILASIFVLSVNFIYAQEVYNKGGMHPSDSYKLYSAPREKVAGSPGMESIKVGNTTVFIPEGMKVYETEGQVILEDDDAYMGRRFKETEARLKAIEETLKDLKKEIEDLKKK